MYVLLWTWLVLAAGAIDGKAISGEHPHERASAVSTITVVDAPATTSTIPTTTTIAVAVPARRPPPPLVSTPAVPAAPTVTFEPLAPPAADHTACEEAPYGSPEEPCMW